MLGGMILFVIILTILVLCLSFHLIGGLLKLLFFLVIGLPAMILLGITGVLLCCTVILIPLGIGCFKLMGLLFFPFRPGIG